MIRPALTAEQINDVLDLTASFKRKDGEPMKIGDIFKPWIAKQFGADEGGNEQSV